MADLWRICMESLFMNYKLVNLKLKSKAQNQIY